MKEVEVKAARAHRSGYAPTRKVKKGDTYTVPEDRVASLVRQKLIEDPSAGASKPKKPQKPSTPDAAGGDGQADI